MYGLILCLTLPDTHGIAVTTAQAIYYYMHYRNDALVFKVLVAWVVALDVFHQICIEHNGE